MFLQYFCFSGVVIAVGVWSCFCGCGELFQVSSVNYNDLHQTCTTYGPRAKCGLWKLLIWPAQPQILFILLVTLIKTPCECVKRYQLLHLDMSKKICWPDLRFELCATDLQYQVKKLSCCKRFELV